MGYCIHRLLCRCLLLSVVCPSFSCRTDALTVGAVHVPFHISFSSVGGALGTAIAVNWWREFVHFQKFQVVVIIWLVCAAVADVLITATLVWYLVRPQPFFSSRARCVTMQCADDRTDKGGR